MCVWGRRLNFLRSEQALQRPSRRRRGAEQWVHPQWVQWYSNDVEAAEPAGEGCL